MLHPPLVLSQVARVLVDKVMREHCRIRSWDLRALAVRSNHVHVVIAAPAIEPEPIVKQLKEWGTRTLQSHRIIGMRQLAWADHGSTIYLYEAGSLEKAIAYVLEAQNAPRDEYLRPDWRERLGL
jgi:REP element-mobilizing transposase RayT